MNAALFIKCRLTAGRGADLNIRAMETFNCVDGKYVEDKCRDVGRKAHLEYRCFRREGEREGGLEREWWAASASDESA